MIAALAGALAACAVSAPLDLRSTGAGATSLSEITLASPAEPETGDRAQFADALTQAFARHGLRSAAAAQVVADFAFAISPAGDGIVAGDPQSTNRGVATQGAADAEPQLNWLAQPRRARRFDQCAAQRMRATLVLFDRGNGQQVYRGQASQIECGFTDADIAAMADALVKDAIARTASQPTGG
jgi:hypothetical protein